MSATRDKSQKITFVYSNLYSIYRKGLDRAREGATQGSDQGSPSAAAEAANELLGLRTKARAFESGLVIKAKDLKAPVAPATAPRVTPYTPAELLGKRLSRPASIARPQGSATLPAVPPIDPQDAVASLKQNLAALNDLQARLRFMLKELEELSKE